MDPRRSSPQSTAWPAPAQVASLEIRRKSRILETAPEQACESGTSEVCSPHDQAQTAPVATKSGPCRLWLGTAADRESCAGGRGDSASCAISCARAGCVQPHGFCPSGSTATNCADSDPSCPSETTGTDWVQPHGFCPSGSTATNCADSDPSCPSGSTGSACVQPHGFCPSGSTSTACVQPNGFCPSGSTSTACVQPDGFCPSGSTSTDFCRRAPGSHDEPTRGRGGRRA